MGKVLAVGSNVVILACYVAGAGLWVASGSAWYRSLKTPGWQPPDAVFGIAWPYNFAMLAIVGTLITVSGTRGQQWLWLGFFALSVIGALGWANLFYVQRSLPLAAAALGLALLMTLPMTAVAFRFETWAGIAMLPYVAWLGIATSLSIGYSVLN